MGGDLIERVACVGEHRESVDSGDVPVVDDDAAVDHDGFHVAWLGAQDKAGDWVVVAEEMRSGCVTITMSASWPASIRPNWSGRPIATPELVAMAPEVRSTTRPPTSRTSQLFSRALYPGPAVAKHEVRGRLTLDPGFCRSARQR